MIGNKIKLPKLGLVRFAKSREVERRIINATIRRNPSGKYFISVLAETNVQVLPKTNRSCGVDVGLKNFAILSDGTVYQNSKFFRMVENKFAKAQRILSRRQEIAFNQNKSLAEAKNLSKTKTKSGYPTRKNFKCPNGLLT